MTYYLGITIGPITRFLGSARRLRELWFCSYTFSFLMKSICNELTIKYGDSIIFILPNHEILKEGSKKGVGTYPDRLIVASKSDLKLDIVRSIIESVLVNYASLIQVPGLINFDEALKFSQQYFRVNSIKLNIDDLLNTNSINSSHENISRVIDLLQQADLENRIIEFDENRFLQRLFNKLPDTEFFKSQYKTKQDDRFPSLLEIATASLLHNLPNQDKSSLINKYFFNSNEENDNSFFKELKNLVQQNVIKSHHKYVAIVTADADGVGNYLSTLNDVEKLKFSETMFNWSNYTYNILKEFSAVPIYVGGDDLLFVSPIVSNGSDIIELCKIIQREFKITVNSKNMPDLGISFGISIFYYKFPLAEALINAHELLAEMKFNKKVNHLNILVRKHSGRKFQFSLDPNSAIYSKFLDTLKFANKDNLLNSFIHNLHEFSDLHEYIGVNFNRRTNFFKNNIEDYSSNKYLESSTVLLNEIILKEQGELKSSLELTYNLLRYINFAKGLDENDN
ncbi:MAG: hypothetical protein JNL49_02845 [Bacteroidia bacterium]|nr:hypothetical protein [Bacteroidia bacterium]